MLAFACQALSGKGHGLEEACNTLSLKEPGEVSVPFGDGGNYAGVYVTDLGPDPQASEAEPISEYGSRDIMEARARPTPLFFEGKVPLTAKPGQQIRAKGLNGPVMLDLPPDAVPGSICRFAMKGKARYLVEVPPRAGPGWTIKFPRCHGGEEVRVVVPPGKRPGDDFEVTPPAFMVQVPEGASPGDYVKFCGAVHPNGDTHGTSGSRFCFFKAVIPEGFLPGQYFVAIIPPPPPQQQSTELDIKQHS